MARDYTKIVAWQRAHALTLAVYKATQSFPRTEVFGLTSQLRRASYGVPSNMAEGSARNSKRDYLHFLNIAQSSLRETEYFLLLSRDLGYLSEAQHRETAKLVDGTFAPLHGLVNAVKREAGTVNTLIAVLTSSVAVALSKYCAAGALV